MSVKLNPSSLAIRTTTSVILQSYSKTARGTEQGVESLIRTAKNLVSSPTAAMQCKGLALFRELTDKGHPFAIQDTAVPFLIASTDSGVRAECLQLLLILIEKGREIDVVLDATNRLFHTQSPLSSESMKLFAALVSKKKAIKEATVAAEFHVISLDASDQVLGISLYEALVAAGQVFENAASAAFRLYQTTQNKVVCEGALSLIKSLLRREMAHEQAFECASSLVHGEKIHEVQQGRELYQEMLRLKYFSPRMVQDADFLMASTDSLSLCLGLQLFTDLVRAGHGSQEAERAAATGLRSLEKTLQSKALKLIGILAEKNLGSNGIIAASACSFIRSQDEELQELASPLMVAMIRQHQMYEMAEDTALFLYQSPQSPTQCHCLTILTALVEEGQSYNNAEDIACILADMSKEESVHEKVLELFSALVQKGQALASARRVAGNLVSSRHLSVGKSALHLLAACKDMDKKESK